MDSDYFGFIVNSKSTEKEIKSDLVSSGVVFKGTVSEKRFQGYRCESGIAIFASPGSLEITLTINFKIILKNRILLTFTLKLNPCYSFNNTHLRMFLTPIPLCSSEYYCSFSKRFPINLRFHVGEHLSNNNFVVKHVLSHLN